MKRIQFFAGCLLLVFILAESGRAQSLDSQRKLVNANTVSVLGGSVKGTYLKFVSDMAGVFNNGYDFRVVPVVGEGSFKGLEDLLLLRGIDAALLQSDVLDFAIELDLYPDLPNLIRYLTVLYNEEVHLIARNDIKSIQDLQNKKVNFGPASSGTFMTSSVIFDRLNITVEALQESYQDGLQSLRNGEIDAMVRVAGAPVTLVEEIKFEDGLKLLEVPLVEGSYYETTLDSETYPDLIPQGNSVKTIAVAAVLAAYNFPWDHPRRAKVDKLYTELSEGYTEFRREPFHPKWNDVEFDRALPGWTRWKRHDTSS